MRRNGTRVEVTYDLTALGDDEAVARFGQPVRRDAHALGAPDRSSRGRSASPERCSSPTGSTSRTVCSRRSTLSSPTSACRLRRRTRWPPSVAPQSRTVRELVDATGQRPSTFTGVLDRLERRGLIERRAYPTDRRSILVDLNASRQRRWRTGRRCVRRSGTPDRHPPPRRRGAQGARRPWRPCSANPPTIGTRVGTNAR